MSAGLRAAAPALVLALACAAGVTAPGVLAPLRPLIMPLLALVMFAMGVTLTTADLARIARAPRPLLLGAALQFGVMPLAAWAVAAVLGLPPAYAAGLVLTGAAPGGTASNVMAWLARADVALSVGMTTVSTLLAPLLTPLLTWWLAGARVDVPAAAMMRDTALVVLVPVAGGMLIRAVLPGLAGRAGGVLGALALAVVGLLVAIILAGARPQLGTVGPLLVAAVAVHNLTGLAAGYAAAALLRAPVAQRRAVAIEVGMQNSGLAGALAVKFLPAGAALPAALFSVWHNLSALVLAAWWRRRPG